MLTSINKLDIFSNKSEDVKPSVLSLTEKNINIEELNPVPFYDHYYVSNGRFRVSSSGNALGIA